MIEKINQEIANCQYCPFLEYKYNEKKELGFGHQRRIMFVGICPAVTSNKSAGMSSFDYYFEKLLLKVEIVKDDFYFTNLCKTSIPPGVILTQEQESHCYYHLKKEILAIRPQIIVLLGRPVRKAFDLNWPETISLKIFKNKEETFKVPVFAIKHPGYLKYSPEEEEAYLVQLRKIYKFYKPTLF